MIWHNTSNLGLPRSFSIFSIVRSSQLICSANAAWDRWASSLAARITFARFLHSHALQFTSVLAYTTGYPSKIWTSARVREQTMIKQVSIPEKVLSLLWKKQKEKVRAFGDFWNLIRKIVTDGFHWIIPRGFRSKPDRENRFLSGCFFRLLTSLDRVEKERVKP